MSKCIYDVSEDCNNTDCLTCVLDKIKAEIFEEKEYAYANFEAYKIDYLMQDEEDVLDSLPQDDFRYGLERAIEIINKYKRESEGKEDGNGNNHHASNA